MEHNAAEEAMALPAWVTHPTIAVYVLVSTTFILIWWIAEFVAKLFLTTGGASAWYPTAGLGVALLWALGLRYAWVIFPAALLSGSGVWEYEFTTALITSLAKTMTYSGAAMALRRALPPGQLPQRPIQVGGPIAVLLGCAVVTAAVCVGTLVLTGTVAADSARDAMIGWAVGDAVGMLVTAPLLVMVIAPWVCLMVCRDADENKTKYVRAVGVHETFTRIPPWLIIVGTTAVLAALSCVPEHFDPRVYYIGFVLLPAIAMRYRLAGGQMALLLVSLAAVITADVKGIELENIEDLQFIMTALSISTFIVGAFAVMRAWAEERRQNQQRWATMALRGSGMGRWIWDLQTNTLTTDYVLTDAFGYRRDKVEPTVAWWEQRVHPEDVHRNRHELERLLKGKGEYYEAENRMLAADGSWGWYHSQGTVVERDPQGKPRRIVGTHHDITEQKELERIRADAEATHRSEQRFRTLADGAPVAIFQTDAKGVLLYVNPAWQRMTGHEQTDALYRGFVAFTHPDDRKAVANHWASAVKTSTPLSVEHRVVTPDRRTLWLQTQATPMQHNQVLLGFVGTAVDVTPYREAMTMIRDSEARYRTLADHAYDMLWRVNADADFTYLSPSATKLLGYRTEDIVGTNAFTYFHHEDIERVRVKYAALSPENPEFHDVHRYRRNDGSYIVFEAVGRLVVPTNSIEQPYITGISRDVTQRVEGERIRRELEEKLARSQKLDAIGTFATGIAHDFRNSLLAIKASAQSAARTLDDEHPARPALGTVEDACSQAMLVTQSLLTFARGSGSTTKRQTDLVKLVRDNTRLLSAVVTGSIELKLVCPEQPLFVHANAGEIQQALLNLVMNAKDATRARGEIRIDLSTRDHLAVLRVSDDGCGMTPDVLNRALEPFFTTKARLKGTGLGLAQVHGIITDHGGEITLHSVADQGTTITLTLPIIQNPKSNSKPNTEAARS